MEYTGPDRRVPRNQGWHLKKEVNLSLIISVIGIAIACVTGYTDLKRDIALMQADAVVVHKKLSDLDAQDDKTLSIIRDQYQRLDSKLDRLIERNYK